MKLIFLGPPGSGKGTQAAIVSSQTQVDHISTGEILRMAVGAQTSLGQQAQSFMDKGELVPDELVLGLVKERLQAPIDISKGWILDGFPRNVAQAQSLDQLLQEIDQPIDRALNLDVPDEVLVQRLLARGRKDDTESVIRNRLEVYRQQTAPLIDFYQDRHQLVSIDGNRAVEQVTQDICQFIP
jgi:adenylate kinase